MAIAAINVLAAATKHRSIAPMESAQTPKFKKRSKVSLAGHRSYWSPKGVDEQVVRLACSRRGCEMKLELYVGYHARGVFNAQYGGACHLWHLCILVGFG